MVLLRVLLSWLPFRWIFGWSQRWENTTRQFSDPGLGTAQERDLAALVRRVSRRVPKATCLTQALSLQYLLARRRRHSKLRIGVGRQQGGVFRAHAWLETDHGIVIGGGEDLGMYRPLSR